MYCFLIELAYRDSRDSRTGVWIIVDEFLIETTKGLESVLIQDEDVKFGEDDIERFHRTFCRVVMNQFRLTHDC